MVDFETATKLLDKLGVKYSQEYEYRGKPPNRESHQIPLFTHVDFGFTKIEWFEVASSAGEAYIGGCCGTTSAAQDVISHWFRFDPRSIPVNELEELAYIMASHDDVASLDDLVDGVRITFAGLDRPVEEVVEIAKPHWQEMWPLDRMALVWHIIKDARRTQPVHTGKTKERTEVERAIGLASSAIGYFWRSGFHAKNPETESQDKAGDALMMYRLLPALRTIQDHIVQEKYPGPLEGYALWNIEDDHVATNGFGPCVFFTKEECETLIATWEKNQENYEEREKVNFREKLSIKRVRVSIENGLEILE